MVDPSLQEINDREAQSGEQDQPTNPDDGGDDGDAGMLDDLPIPAISKKHLVLVAVVVVAILVWQSRSSGDSGGNAAEQMQKARQGDFTSEVEANPDESEDYDPDEAGRARIPVKPNNELEKDAAAMEFLIENGTISGGEN